MHYPHVVCLNQQNDWSVLTKEKVEFPKDEEKAVK